MNSIKSKVREALKSIPSVDEILNNNYQSLTIPPAFFKFHLNKRLEQSLVLIKNTPMSLKTIASSLAFKSFPHFSRAFKLKYGISPNKFRKGRN